MSESIRIATDPRAVVLYETRDAHGRQRIEVRTGKGVLLQSFRRVRSLANWIKARSYNYYEYRALAARTRKALDNWRAGYDKDHRPEQPHTPKVGDAYPELTQLKEQLQ